ncbi:MAG TPA: GTPase Era [Labilithrix sp.]|nr:GTPase Era [Labilithrix sp.]
MAPGAANTPASKENRPAEPEERSRSRGEGKRKQAEKAKRKPRDGRPRAGTIALIGRPNVGKSTLLNAMLGMRLAITSHHPQTTRDRIAAILTVDGTQYVFLDTPGIHKAKNRLGHRMNDLASGTAADADAVLFVVDVGRTATPEIRQDDAEAIRAIPTDKPVVLAVNKIDRVADKEKLFAYLSAYAAMRDFAAVIPISAKKRDGIDRVLDVLKSLLPEGEPLYPEDELSDRPIRFFIAELVREQVLMRTREEVPHGVAVTVDAYEEGKKLTRITLSVHVAKDSHKGIIIGQGGKMLAAIGTAARERAEKLLDQKVHLDIRVKATPGWFDDEARLIDLGYGDETGRPKTTKQKTNTKKKNIRGGRGDRSRGASDSGAARNDRSVE